jgi:hypothetical protein
MGSALLFACRDECVVERGCISDVLEEYEMIPYNGQDIGCRHFMTLHELRGKQYFVLGSHCADIVFTAFDCEGNVLCSNGDDELCRDFQENAIELSIVGIAME